MRCSSRFFRSLNLQSRRIYHILCDTWRVQRQNYGYLPGRRALLLDRCSFAVQMKVGGSSPGHTSPRLPTVAHFRMVVLLCTVDTQLFYVSNDVIAGPNHHMTIDQHCTHPAKLLLAHALCAKAQARKAYVLLLFLKIFQ